MNALSPSPSTDTQQISDAVAGLDAVVAAMDPGITGQARFQCGDNGQLATCTSNLSTCNGNYSTCSGSLATCNGGTAGAANVLSGKTFSSSAGLGLTGTMANNGAVNITPGTSAQTIPAGYHNGTGSVAGETDLVSGNIRSGVNIFGVNGSPSVVNTSAATATAPDMVSGKTAYVNGSLVTGTAAAGSNVNGPNGSKTFTIPDGLYAGSKTATANDTNLVAGTSSRR